MYDITKKIGVVIGGISEGGAERFTANLVNYFNSQKIDVFLYTGQKQENEYEIASGVNRRTIMKGNFLNDIYAIKKDVSDNGISVLIGIGIYNNLCVCADKVLGYKGDVIISERNAPKQDLLSWKSKLLRACLYRFCDKMVFQTYQASLCYSKAIQKKSVIIHNPIKEGLPYRTEKHNREIIFSGRLRKQKNPMLMLNAFIEIHDRHPEYKLRFFGIGPIENEMRDIIKEKRLDEYIIFEGWKSNWHELIKDSDIFVMTSDFEGMPNSLMEAMAMGFPVISSDCPAGGPAELIIPGKNGLLFKVGDKKGLIDKIEYLINNIDEKEKLGKEAANIRDTHSNEIILDRWLYEVIKMPKSSGGGIRRLLKAFRDALRDVFVNRKLRKRLSNTDFTLISSDCTGGLLCHELKLRFNSPTVNMFFSAADYIKFINNMDYYLNVPMVEVADTEYAYPCAMLDDIFLHLVHYNSVAEAQAIWNRRKERINYNNIFFVMNDRNGCTKKERDAFLSLPYNKVFFSHKKINNSDACYVSGYEKDNEVGIMTSYKSFFSIKRRLDIFDFVKWFNDSVK